MKSSPYTVLMVDDEPNVLAAYRRTVGRNFDLTVAEGAAVAMALLDRPEHFAVIVSDMRMPAMNGLEFITAARQKSRDSVFMMLTGNPDQQTAVDAINKGQIFRFLNKPCAADDLETAIRAGIRQHELITAERVLLRDTVSGSIKLMMDALEMASPLAFGYQSAVKRIQQEISAKLGPVADWQLGIAASLCLIGLVALPTGAELTDETLLAAAETGGKLLGYIPRLHAISRMVRRQRESGMLPENLIDADPQTIEDVGARVLRFSVDLARAERTAGSRSEVIARLEDTRRYDARLIRIVKPAGPPVVSGGSGVLGAATLTAQTSITVATDKVEPGMQLFADILLTDGRLLLSKGQTVSDLAAAKLRNYFASKLVGPTVRIAMLVSQIIPAAAA